MSISYHKSDNSVAPSANFHGPFSLPAFSAQVIYEKTVVLSCDLF